MAKAKGNEIDFPFYRIMWQFYSANKREIKKSYTKLTRDILSHAEPSKDNPNAFLRKPQYEAFEMYVFLKEYLGNPRLADLFDSWQKIKWLEPRTKRPKYLLPLKTPKYTETDKVCLAILNKQTATHLLHFLNSLRI